MDGEIKQADLVVSLLAHYCHIGIPQCIAFLIVA